MPSPLLSISRYVVAEMDTWFSLSGGQVLAVAMPMYFNQ